MNLAIIYNIQINKPECVIAHDYTNGDIGYSTYNTELSNILNIIFNNNLNSTKTINNIIYFNSCNLNNSFYLNCLNDYLPYPYKIIWIKKMNEDINKLLEEAYDLLDEEGI